MSELPLGPTRTTRRRDFSDAAWHQNPAWGRLLGLCPLMAVTTTVENALGLAVASAFVVVGSAVTVSTIRALVPAEVRLPFFVLVIATFTSAVTMLMQAFAFDLYERVALFRADHRHQLHDPRQTGAVRIEAADRTDAGGCAWHGVRLCDRPPLCSAQPASSPPWRFRLPRWRPGRSLSRDCCLPRHARAETCCAGCIAERIKFILSARAIKVLKARNE